ncbi:MAG: alpha/beta fold hydrolase [Chloroflexi bacterium]|nr:alpha/beta fold hydrolase [Chloroflexota bacterium]
MLPNNGFQGEEHQPFFWPGGKAAVLFVHGFPGTPAEMRPLAESLHRAGWTAQGILLPGFGNQIETLLERTNEDWLSAVTSALAQLQREHAPVLVVGYSLGGALALQAAARYSPTGLVVLSPFWKVEHVLWALLPVLKPIFRGVRPFKMLKLDLGNPEVRAGIQNFWPDADLDDPQVQAVIRDFRLPLALFDQIKRAGGQGSRAARSITSPTLIIQGDADELVRPALTRRLLDRFSVRPRYVEVSGGHDLLLPDKPAWAEVERAVHEFAMSL